MTSLLDHTYLEEEVVIAYDDDGNQIFTHYGKKGEVTEGYVMGTPVLALCGKVFIPYRDPLKYPVCKECEDIVNALYLNREH
jgi:hypothetical protein